MQTHVPDNHNHNHNHKLSAAEFEAVRALHSAVRSEVQACWAKSRQGTAVTGSPDVRRAMGQQHRIALLAWAFVRGIPYRRVEACRHLQVILDLPPESSLNLSKMARAGAYWFEHGKPNVVVLHAFLSRYLPDLAIDRLDMWLSEPVVWPSDRKVREKAHDFRAMRADAQHRPPGPSPLPS